MKLRIEISEREGAKGYPYARRFSFAVIDLEKGEAYPLNFVCMLPMKVSSDGKAESAFVRVFGDRSVEVARQLLLEALERETEAEVKVEIERRLELLEPKVAAERKCLACGQVFQVKPTHGFKQKYCPECLKRKFGNRR